MTHIKKGAGLVMNIPPFIDGILHTTQAFLMVKIMHPKEQMLKRILEVILKGMNLKHMIKDSLMHSILLIKARNKQMIIHHMNGLWKMHGML